MRLESDFRGIMNQFSLSCAPYGLVSVGSPETLSTVTCNRGMLVAFIVGEVV
jgi:hypothetical protein